MRLISPGVGELSDRLSILSLKILFGGEAGKDVKHFEVEKGAILSQLRSRDLNGKWFTAYTELAAVNAALWHVENELRGWRSPKQAYGASDMEAIRVVAFRIQAFNDRRAELVATINQEAGDGGGAEKL